MNNATKRLSDLRLSGCCTDAGTVQPGASFSKAGAHGRGPHQSSQLRRVGTDLGLETVQLAAQLRRASVVPAVEGPQSVLSRRRTGR